jgi:hypothetical protein
MLALPFLPSLLSRPALAKAPARPPRLLWLTTNHGGTAEASMFPNLALTASETVHSGHTVGSAALNATIEGADRKLSPVLTGPSSKFTDALLRKMNVLRGIDIPFYIAHHTGGHLGNYARNDGNGSDGKSMQTQPRPTIDQLIGWSPSFYPNLSSIKQRVMNMGPLELSWNYSNAAAKSGPIQAQKGSDSSLALFNSIFVPPDKAKRKPIVDYVLEDYKSLRQTNTRLSSEDRRRLDDHVANMSELQRKLNATASCGAITQPSDDANRHMTLQSDDAIAWANLFIEVAIAAFVCGTSRIGTLGLGYYKAEEALGQYAGDWHQDVAHAWATPLAQTRLVASYQRFFSRIVLETAVKLDAIDNGMGGKMLDDTLLVWTQECGASTHDSYSLPIVTFGSASGALKTGKLCDYRRMNNPDSAVEIRNATNETTSLGLLYGRWLATVMQSMGLKPSEFELWGHKGYGVPFLGMDYGPPYLKHYGSTTSPYFQSSSDPLPFLWS